MTGAVVTHGLTRRFGPVTAVDGLTLDLPAGGVIGLVGPNGSGKSTLIRMLLGLVRPTSGDAEVLGSSIRTPARTAPQIGALVESPAFVPGLSARANLLSLARLRGLPASRVAEVLLTVGLAGRENEPVRRYSLGMKQRLGIAAALLADPQVLVLDEPTNGLDPAGIVEIRSLLVRLGREGKTVLVSSHLMSEIEAACDWIVVVRFGRLLFSGPTGELLARAATHVEVRPEHAADQPALRAALDAAGWSVQSPGEAPGSSPVALRVAAPASDAAAINRTAAAAGITLSGLVAVQDSLEQVFLELTGRDDAELAAARAGHERRARGAEAVAS